MVEILLATIMRAQGETGVQTHVRTLLAWLQTQEQPAGLLTPFDAPRWQVYPVFGLRRVIERLNRSAGVWWYRHWHALFLERMLRARLADGQPRVIYAQCPLSAAAALRARRSLAQKVVLVVHFNVSQADEWAGKGLIASDGAYAGSIRAFEARVLPALDGLVFVSDFMRRELLARMPAIGDVPYVRVPNFVPDPGSPAPAEMQADLLLVGTLEPRKNQAYALDILAAALAQGHTLTLTVAGDGPDRKALQQRAETLGLSEQVRFAGFVRDAARLFARHRACLHTARIENLPLTLIEAMSRGVPVFAPPVGGVPEVFNDGVEGRLIPLDDAPQAARLLLQWLGQPARLAVAGRLARARFLTHFESDVAAARLRDFLQATALESGHG